MLPASAASIGVREVAPDQQLSPENAERARALALFYKGNQLTSEGDIEGAVAAFREVLATDSANIRLAARTADLVAQLGRLDEGLEIVEEARRANPGDIGAAGSLIAFLRTYYPDDQAAQVRAVEIAREAVEQFPKDPRSYRFLCSLYLEFEDYAAASVALEIALSQEDVSSDFWVLIGAIGHDVWPYKGGRRDDANLEKLVEIYYRALERGSDTPLDVQMSVADFFFRTGQLDDARGLYQGMVMAAPEDLRSRLLLARTLLAMRRSEEGIAELEKLVEIDPNDAVTRETLATVYEGQELWAEAAGHKIEAIRLGSGTLEDYFKAYDYFNKAGDIDGSLNLLERAGIAFPEDPRLPLLAAAVYRYQERWDEAYDSRARAETLTLQYPNPEASTQLLDNDFYYYFGEAAERLKKFDRAAELFRKSIDLVPEENPEEAAQAYNYLGYMWLEQETNLEEAGNLIRLAVELIPENGAYADSLGWYYFLTGDYQNAVSELQRADTLMRDSYANFFQDALEAGTVSAADRDSSKGADPVILEHLAQAYAKLGKLEKAVATMEQAISLEGATPEMGERLERYKNGASE